MKLTYAIVAIHRYISSDYIKKSLLSLRAIGVAGFMAGLVACGGGGGGGAAPPASTTTYLHYMSGSTTTRVAGTLTTIDPAAPATTTNTNPALVGYNRVAYVSTGTISAGTVSNMRRYAVVFSSGGMIKKQSAVVGTTVPAAVQISSASGITSGPGDGTANAAATDLCELRTFPDFQAPDNSGVFYGLAGTDLTCGNTDDAYSWLRLNTPAGTAPTPVTGVTSEPVSIYNTSTGAITGFVALNTAGALTKFDANLANPVVVPTGAGPFSGLEALVDITANGHMLLLAGNSIRTYDPASNTLGATVLATISQPGSFYGYTYDATNFYFVDNPLPNYSTNVIQRISLTTASPAAASPVVTEAAGARINISWNAGTPNRLVYSMTSGTDNSLQSIVRTATSATSSTRLYPAAATTDSIRLAGSTSTGRVYMTRMLAGGAVTAAVINDDATGLMTHADAQWNGSITDTTFSLFGGAEYLSQLVLLQRNAAGKTTDDGATLTAYDAAAHTVGAVLGNVPVDITSVFGPWESGAQALLTGNRTGGGTDIFYVNVLSAGSLTRVTIDAAVEDRLYF